MIKARWLHNPVLWNRDDGDNNQRVVKSAAFAGNSASSTVSSKDVSFLGGAQRIWRDSIAGD